MAQGFAQETAQRLGSLMGELKHSEHVIDVGDWIVNCKPVRISSRDRGARTEKRHGAAVDSHERCPRHSQYLADRCGLPSSMSISWASRVATC